MARKKYKNHELKLDPQWRDERIAKFINMLMWDGKKNAARRVMYTALEHTAKMAKVENPLIVFTEALENVSPSVEVKSRRVGGANYQVPVEVRGSRRSMLAMRWLIQAARAKKGKPMADRLADEFMSAAKNEGTAIKKRNDTHRMAEANRAFAHFAW